MPNRGDSALLDSLLKLSYSGGYRRIAVKVLPLINSRGVLEKPLFILAPEKSGLEDRTPGSAAIILGSLLDKA